MQVNVVEERRKRMSAILAYEMIQVGLVYKLFSIQRVKQHQQEGEHSSCNQRHLDESRPEFGFGLVYEVPVFID